jgi:hypothetical protein
MKLKTLIVTIAALAVLSVVAFIARRPEAPAAADARVNQPLVTDATAEQIAKIRLSDQGKTVSLDRQADGTWQVTSYYNLPADFQKLSAFVGSLTEARLQRLVTSNAERISRLDFKDTKIDLQDASGKELLSLTLGKNADTGGGRFVRFGTEQKAYLTNLNAWLDAESKNWAHAELPTLKPDDISKIELTIPDAGPVVLVRTKKEDPWIASPTPEGKKLRADKVSSVVSSLTSLRFTETNEPADANVTAAKANLQTVKLTTFDNKTVTVALGRKPEEKKLKPPGADGKSGPGSLGSVSDLTKKDSADNKPLAPEFETIPAGPVFAFITHSDANAPVNAWMGQRAFQIGDYVFTGLPQKMDDLFEPAPAPAPTPAPAPAAEKKQ